ncbi:MAG: SPL family radical SAM protein [Anaerovoracaceae bacterium]
MHEVKVKGILSAKNGMNLYRGCSHGCIYCDSRSRCYQMDHDFEDIEVKSNGLELLEDALRRKRNKCMIGTGSMSDPYIPLEKELCYTRGALELICRHRFGATLITKSDMVLRDLDLLQEIHRKTRAVVQMTLTTWDDALCKIVEPGVCPTSRRFQVLKEFQKAGIPTVVWLTPILPYINDTMANLQALLECCVDAGVRGILWFGAGVTLRDGNREYFYQQLDRQFPGMKEQYRKEFGNSYVAASRNDRQLSAMVKDTCGRYGILSEPDRVFAELQRFEEKEGGEQLSFLL